MSTIITKYKGPFSSNEQEKNWLLNHVCISHVDDMELVHGHSRTCELV